MKKSVKFALDNVGKRVLVPTNPYGAQCAAFVDKIMQVVTDGKMNLAYTNAIDMLKKAKSLGIPVELDGPNKRPKAGAIIVYNTGDKFGHVDIAVTDSDGTFLDTVGQNVDGYSDNNHNGINDQLEINGGGPARRRRYTWYANGDAYIGNYKLGKVVGWFYIPNDTEVGEVNKLGNNFPSPVMKGADLYSGLITHVDENPMNADKNRVKIDRVIIHHNAGLSDSGARSTWYVSTGHGTSAHYQVTPDKIWGCVGENFVAYHAGNYPMNQRSIGIEHLNNTGAPTWTIAEETYKNSAKLVADICKRYNIPCDRKHILKHSEVSNAPTACPGGIDIDRIVRMANDILKGGSQKEVPAKATVSIKNINQKELTYEVVVSNINSPNGIKKVLVPTWTKNKEQDDLVWHEATKLSNGDYVYKVKASEHKNEQGIYISHVYILTNLDKKYFVGGHDLYLNKQAPTGKVDVAKNDTGFKVTVTDVTNPNGVKEVVVPVWTDKDGQDDIKWYTATKSGDIYTVEVKTDDHKKELGKYHVHVYVKQKNDQLMGVSNHTVELHPASDKDNNETVILVTKEGTNIKHIIVTEEEFEKLRKQG